MVSLMAASTSSIPDAQFIAVIGERHRRQVAAATAQLQWTAGAGQRRPLGGQVVAPEADVVEVAVCCAPRGSRAPLRSVRGAAHRLVAHGRGEEDVSTVAVPAFD